MTATAIYTTVGVRTHDAIYAAVFAWASLGIVLQTLETDRSVRLAAAAGCAVAAVVSLVSLVQGRKYGRPVSPHKLASMETDAGRMKVSDLQPCIAGQS